MSCHRREDALSLWGSPWTRACIVFGPEYPLVDSITVHVVDVSCRKWARGQKWIRNCDHAMLKIASHAMPCCQPHIQRISSTRTWAYRSLEKETMGVSNPKTFTFRYRTRRQWHSSQFMLNLFFKRQRSQMSGGSKWMRSSLKNIRHY